MLLYACQDLVFATKIGSTAEALGVAARRVHDAEEAVAAMIEAPDRAGEPATGLLVDLELGEAARDLIREAKAHQPGTIVIGFGAHVEKETLEAARSAGADEVMPRSRFTQKLPDLVAAHGDA